MAFYGEGSVGFDLWTSTRATVTAPFPAPVHLTALSTDADEVPGWLSADGCRLYFGSTRSGNNDSYVAIRDPE